MVDLPTFGKPTIPQDSAMVNRPSVRPYRAAPYRFARQENPRGGVGYHRMRQMKVDKLGIDLLTHDPVVILKDMDGSHYLPILIGPFEATAIALALEGAPGSAPAFARPHAQHPRSPSDAVSSKSSFTTSKTRRSSPNSSCAATANSKRSMRAPPTASPSPCASKPRSSSPTRSCSRKQRPKRNRPTTRDAAFQEISRRV
jgi:hypothetical protein